MTEQIPPSSDGLYLIQDLLELRSLLKGSGGLLARLGSIVSSLRRRSGVRSVADIFKLAADSHLSYLFGFSATATDIGTFANKILSFYDRLRFLRETQGRLFTQRSARSFPINWASSEIYATTGVANAPQRWIARPVKGKAIGRTELVLKNELSGLDGLLSEIKASSANIGLGHLATFAWDLVPYSFLVDWVFHVNKILDRYARIQPFGGQLVVHDSLCSHKCELEYRILFHPAPNYGNEEQLLGTFYYKRYQRSRSLRASVGSLMGSSSLSAQQLAILTSLAIQRGIR